MSRKQTTPIPAQEPTEPKKIGRPRKKKRKKPKKPMGRKRIKRTFDETLLGCLLKYEAPIEYKLIMEAQGDVQAPSADFIEAISYASINPLFRKTKFRRALIYYRQRGIYAKHRNVDLEEVILYHQKIYEREMKKKFNGD